MNRIAVFAFVAVVIVAVAVAADFYVDHELNSPEFILAQQKRCAKQTERVVAGSGWKQSNSPVNGTVASYTDHYNARLGRCLILFKYIVNDMATKDTRKSFTLVDAFRQATYAEYFEADLPGFNPLVSTCRLTIPSEKPVVCHSREEWNRLIKPYIETGAPSKWN
ncbi:MAG TPA: hypothetical protein VNX86_13615 [Rhizomicrobium sp.]|jgi:hypothetical protein|nr:hypothetical protein [Rhizomicrobium sp.]